MEPITWIDRVYFLLLVFQCAFTFILTELTWAEEYKYRVDSRWFILFCLWLVYIFLMCHGFYYFMVQ